MLSLLGRLVFSLGVVLLLMALLARVLRNRAMPGLGRSPVKRDVLQVLARQSLSRTASIAVVQAADRALVVGITDQGVSVLAEIDPTELEAHEPDVPGLPSASPTSRQGVVDLLRDRTTRRS